MCWRGTQVLASLAELAFRTGDSIQQAQGKSEPEQTEETGTPQRTETGRLLRTQSLRLSPVKVLDRLRSLRFLLLKISEYSCNFVPFPFPFPCP